MSINFDPAQLDFFRNSRLEIDFKKGIVSITS